MKKILFFSVVLNSFIIFGQTDNMDFEDGNFNGWQLAVGTRTSATNENYDITSGNILNTQIRIMNPSVPPLDEYGILCGGLNIPTAFPGGAFSARIGDNPGGRRAARISRTFTVTPDEAYLQYSYAIIMEEPGHSQNDQPKFVVNIKDGSGDVVTCGKFEAFAGPDALSKGFVACNYDRSYRCDFPISDCPDSPDVSGFFGWPVQILPWVSGGADLTPYIGQQITIEFVSLDCMLGGHGMTAYVEATVEPLTIQVNGLCTAGPNDITLTAPIGFVSYLWSTGETTQSINVSGAQFGDTFSVDLISNTGCDTSATITLEPKPSATIDPIPNQIICQGARTLIAPTGTNAGSFSFPDIGATGLSTVVSPTVTTTYTVVALDENGCVGESTTVTIEVLTTGGAAFPTAAFELEPIIVDNANPCNTVQFNNISDYCKNDLTYEWDFGDGSVISTEENPIHEFPTNDISQTYFVTLTVTSTSDGLTDSLTIPFRATSINPSFFAIEDCGVVTITNYSFICGSTFDLYPSFSYSWDFGDGNPLIITGSDQPSFDYTYTSSGSYNITLTMTDTNSGAQFILERPIAVSVGLQPNFTYFPDCFDVQFINTSTFCDPIVSYEWDFGDGTPISSDVSPIHTYSTVGPHTVTLTVNDGMVTRTYTGDITLTPDVTTPDFSFSVVCNEVNFVDRTDSCSDLTYQWDFGDGSAIDTSENPVHVFEYDTTYQIILTVNDGTEDFSVSNTITIASAFDYNAPEDLLVCSVDESIGSAFSLVFQSDIILGNVDPNLPFRPIVTYHLTEVEAENGINAQSVDFINTMDPQSLFARVEENLGCYRVFPFEIKVEEIPIVNTIEDINLCSSQETSRLYDLSQLNARLFEGLDQSNVNLTYHESEDDANQNLNPIINVNLIAGIDTTVFTRAENIVEPSCFSINQFNLRLDNQNTDVDDICLLTFANVLTPNGDGANDTFFIDKIESFPNNRLTIYNRWGNKVYETLGYKNNWSGTYQGKPLPVATYYYIIELNDEEKRKHSGYISILR